MTGSQPRLTAMNAVESNEVGVLVKKQRHMFIVHAF